MAASSIPLHFDANRTHRLYNNNFLLRKTPLILHLSSRSTSVIIPSAKFNFFEMLGGRGLCNGEKGLAKELERDPESPPYTYSSAAATDPPLLSLSNIGGEEGFEKELLGLTGGFPGGERGLQSFLEKNPPPIKRNGGGEGALGVLLYELERREKGPAMVNPNSAIQESVVDNEFESDRCRVTEK